MDRGEHRAQLESLGRVLRRCRNEAGLSQQEVARTLGLPQSYVSKYESAERRLDLVELAAVCQALGLPLEEVIARFYNEPGE